MFTATDHGTIDRAIARLTALEAMAAPFSVQILVSDRTKKILESQAKRGRDALSVDAADQAAIDAIAVRYFSEARDGGDPASLTEAMYAEIGEFYRQRVAERIQSLPLIDTGETLRDIASAAVEVRRT